MRAVDDTLVMVSGSVSAEAGPFVRKAPAGTLSNIIAEPRVRPEPLPPCSSASEAILQAAPGPKMTVCAGWASGHSGRSPAAATAETEPGSFASLRRKSRRGVEVSASGALRVSIAYPCRPARKPFRRWTRRCPRGRVPAVVALRRGCISTRPGLGRRVRGGRDSGILSSWSGIPAAAQSGPNRAGRRRSTTTGR